MDELAELHRFNAWANANLLAAVRRLTPEQLDEQRDGMYRSILGVLGHLAWVEFVYVRLMRSEPHERPAQPPTFEQVAAMLEETGPALVALARSAPPDARVRIPWFEREFALAECLRQVLTHSINHRADVNGWLPRFGVESTDQDYIDLVLSER